MNISNMYIHVHTHTLSLYILSSHSPLFIFFSCVLVFYLSSSLSPYLIPSLCNREREREWERWEKGESEEMRWGGGGEMRSEEGRHVDREGREEQYSRHTWIYDSVERGGTFRCWINWILEETYDSQTPGSRLTWASTSSPSAWRELILQKKWLSTGTENW